MYVRKKKLDPFRPSSKSHDFASAADLFPPKPVEQKEEEQNLDAFKDSMRDAETGEPIVLSKAGWNVKEGRLNLNTQTILAMGTGRLDIKNRTKANEATQIFKVPTRTQHAGKLSPIYSGEHTPYSNVPDDLVPQSKLAQMRAGNILNAYSHNDASGFNSPVTSALSSTNISRRNSHQPDTNLNASLLARALQSIPQTPHTAAAAQEVPTGHKRHPLLTQYLKEGPLNPMYHRYWDPRSNTVVVEDEHGQPLEVAEEGVDGSGDEAEGREDHTALATHLSMLNSTVGRSASAFGGDDGSSVTSSSSMTLSLASRLTGSTRRHHSHRRGGSQGTWSHKSRKDNETASTRMAGSAASQAPVDLTVGVVDPSIELSNKRNWQATEERLFQELFALGWQYEHNKSLTREQGGRGGLAEVRQTARAMARLKVKGMQELVQAYADEKIKDEKRMQLESENTHPNKVRYLAELMKLHEEERRKSRRYLHALEQDNEIMLIRKLSETGWLW